MALRVLLADESTTIKKVFQLALQDYAVEVTSVAAGLDVIPAARQFKPDIVFCDVLLQKKNGYEVCAEFKSDPTLQQTPVVLMWSGFMELDKDKLEAARADARLEKPFDVQQLRQLVQKLVPRTSNQRLGQYLNFPKMPEMIDPAGAVHGKPSAPPPPMGAAPTGENWDMESFEPIAQVEADADQSEEFQEMPLPPPPKAGAMDDDDEDDGQIGRWSTRFNIKIPDSQRDQLAVNLPKDHEIELPPEREYNEIPLNEVPLEDDMPRPKKGIDEKQLEMAVREQARAMIEAVVWKVVPDLANQIIEREIKRLLAEKGS